MAMILYVVLYKSRKNCCITCIDDICFIDEYKDSYTILKIHRLEFNSINANSSPYGLTKFKWLILRFFQIKYLQLAVLKPISDTYLDTLIDNFYAKLFFLISHTRVYLEYLTELNNFFTKYGTSHIPRKNQMHNRLLRKVSCYTNQHN